MHWYKLQNMYHLYKYGINKWTLLVLISKSCIQPFCEKNIKFGWNVIYIAHISMYYNVLECIK